MSLFDLPTEPAEAEDVTRWYYQKITANGASNMTQAQPSSTVSFQFAPQGRRWFVPSRSFFNVTAQLTTTTDPGNFDYSATGATQVAFDNVIPAIGGAANIFRACRVLVGGTVVSAVESNMAQIEAVSNRVNRTPSFLRSGGASFNRWSAIPFYSSWSDRPPLTANAAGKNTTLNYSWTPPCGFFEIEHAVPGLEMTIELTFNPDVGKAIMEAAIQDNAASNLQYIPTDTKLFSNNLGLPPTVTNISVEFNAAFVEGPRADETKFVLNFNEWASHVQPYSQSNNFVVRPETDMLVVAMQHKDAGKDMLTPAGRFISRIKPGASGANNPTGYFVYNEKKLMKNVQLEYNGQLFPAQPHPMVFNQLAIDNAINSGLYWTTGETEEFFPTVALGQLMVLQTPKDGTSYATAVSIRSEAETTNPADYNTILFARTPRSFLIRTVDSMVVTVQSADVQRSGSDRGLQSSSVQGSGMSAYGGRRPFSGTSFI